MKRERWYCRACGKTAFPSERQAQGAIDYYQTVVSEGAGKVPKRVYRCPYGNGCHLSSKEGKRA